MKKTFAEILAEEIRQMSLRIDDCRHDRDRWHKTPGYMDDKELVAMAVQATREIHRLQVARTAMKVALAAYTKWKGSK